MTFVTSPLAAAAGLLLGGLDCLEGCCDAFTQIRDSLMEVMSSGHTVMEPNSTNAMCLDCQGKVTERHGLKLYVKTGVGALEPYDYDPLERSVELLRAAVGDAAMDTVQQLMFQKCFCFLASSASTERSPGAATAGPVPPIKQFIEVARDDKRIRESERQGLPVIPSALLYDLCQIAKQVDLTAIANSEPSSAAVPPLSAANRDTLCVDVYSAEINQTMNPCNLTWEPRLLEPAFARCVSSLYLTDAPVDISDVTVANDAAGQVAPQTYKSPSQLAAEAAAAAAAAHL